MSLAADSPSSSDDFAAFLDAELDVASSESSDESVDQDVTDLPQERLKRQKLEHLEIFTEHQESRMIGMSTPPVMESGDKRKCPPHPGFIKGMCMVCGKQEDDGSSSVAFGYIHKDLKLAAKEMDRLRESDLKNLQLKKKLILVLDLDHTLLNSTTLADVSADEEHVVSMAVSPQDGVGRSLFKLDNMHMLTKLRPFVHKFLQEASSMFEMYIYTMAEHSYAKEVAKILDPSNIYFTSKVISQSDCTQRHQKGLDVVLGAESMVVVLDDTEFVWQKHKDNLILMERYHYFASSCSQFGFARSLSQLGKDESESEGALASILAVLKRIHQLFFDATLGTNLSSRDVRQILRRVRGEVLSGFKVVFSRVFPSESVAMDQPIWKMAEQLGAACGTNVDDSVTHVVSMDRGTKKARWASCNQKFLVSPRWIEAANYLWRRPKEEDFPVAAPAAAATVTAVPP